MSLSAGDKLGPYEIVSPIGKGGMGEVWKARDSRLGRDVAIKFSTRQFTDRSEREARAIAALNHPHICTLYDVGPNYLVMEYVEGAELKGPLPVAKAIELACQILDAMDAAHRKGITHRDLKPANIMVTKAGVKVLDFGLAKMGRPVGDAGSTTLTAEGTIAGTLHYMAPEQLQGREVDTRADIFSFGCVLYEMLTGKRAFDGSNGASVIAAVMERPAPSVAEIAPAALDRVLQTCLAKDPDQRCQNARDLKRELMWAVETPSVKKTAPSRSWLSAIIAGVLAVLLAALALVHFREKPQPAEVARFTILPPEKGSFLDDYGRYDIPAISPDGQRLVFGARGADGTLQLWIRPLDAIVPKPLDGTQHGHLPFWSPDGKSIGFFAGGKLKRIEVEGGPALTLADARSSGGGTWSAGGVIVFGSGINQPLVKIPATGGASSPVTKLEALELDHRMPWFLPDGKHFLFTADKNIQGTGSRIRIGSLESAEVHTVVDADSQAIYSPDLHSGRSGQGYLLFVRSNALMAQAFDAKSLSAGTDAVAIAEGMGPNSAQFSASANGTLAYATPANLSAQLTLFDRAGQRLATFGEPDSFGSRLHFSPDRHKIATSITDSAGHTSDVWIYDTMRGFRTRFTFGPAENGNPLWSSDAGTIVFSSTRKGHSDLYRKPANGAGGEELIYADGLDKFPDSWSPDGKMLMYETLDPKTQGDLWILPDPLGKPGISKPYPFLMTQFTEYDGQFSPDGKWIAYTSKESGRFETYVTPFPGPSGKWQISTGGGGGGRWRSDSKEIFYVTLDDRVMAVDVTAKGTTLEVGKAHAVSGPLPNIDFDVSADGQRFLMSVPVQSGPESLTLVQNWMAALKK